MEFQLEKISWLDNLELFSKLEDIFPDTYEKITTNQVFVDRVGEIVAEEMSSVDNSDLDSLKNQIQGIESLYNLSLTDELEELEKHEKEYAAYLDSEAESYIEDRTRDVDERNEMREGRVIEEIFNSLVER
ncbi:hypothetical protein DC498_09280 [Terrimonas sp.]|uniref:hypothetical protein n=1 Tax=Terrimonas sp. TaxID=1914338 RepID=UPI000D50D084|nr:hypothetical protein [Terrimonas sp.]PVD52691.1 hypothetical protein DC498_09280 [Terrimonas sp.]